MSARRLVGSHRPSVPAPNYRRALVSYLDILGFKNLVSAGGRDPAEVRSTVLAVQRHLKRDPADLADGMGVDLAFSDTVVRVSYLPSPGEPRIGALFWEISQLQLAQVELMARGILVRGGVALGDVYVHPGEEIWFGPAIVSAYELEANADFPRVILHPEIEAAFGADPALRSDNNSLEEEREYVRRIVRRDVDGFGYIDPFGANAGDFDSGEEGLVGWYRDVRTELIEAAASYRTNQAVLRKFAWLAHRFQAAVEERFQEPWARELRLSATEFPGLHQFG